MLRFLLLPLLCPSSPCVALAFCFPTGPALPSPAGHSQSPSATLQSLSWTKLTLLDRKEVLVGGKHPVLCCSRSEGQDANRQPLGLAEPDGSNFGRMDYWNEEYRRASCQIGEDKGSDGDNGVFSWYTGWSDLEPFFAEIVPDRSSRVLIPGIGNDRAMVDMYDAGYDRMTAFDYAPEGVECARKMFGPERLGRGGAENDDSGEGRGVDLRVADARSLPFSDGSFDAVLEKGTLDAVYLSGGTDKVRAARHLSMAVSELARVVRPGGIVFSVTAACVEAVQEAFDGAEATVWRQIRDGSFYLTEDGIASNCVDASILAWERI